MVVKNEMVENVKLSKDMAEVMNMQASVKKATKRNISVAYAPKIEENMSERYYIKMVEDTIDCLQRVIGKSENKISMDNLNCTNVCWQNWSTKGSEEACSSKLLSRVMDNVMTQWMINDTIQR